MSSPNGQTEHTACRTEQIPIGLIDPPPQQRQRHDDENPELDDLIGTMRHQGQLQPIIVRRAGDRFELIAGSRRWRAARALGWSTIRAEIRTPNEAQTAIITLVENLARRQISPVEEAFGVAEMLTMHDNDPAPVAKALGRSVRWIEDRRDLLQLAPPVLEALHAGAIKLAHAQALAALEKPHKLPGLLREAITATPPAHVLRQWVDHANHTDYDAPTPGANDRAQPGAGPSRPPRAHCFACQRDVPLQVATTLTICLTCRADIQTPAPPLPCPDHPTIVANPPKSDTHNTTPPE